MSEEVNNPKKFRSTKNILESMESMRGSELKIKYIEKTLADLDNGVLVTADETREKLYSQAIALYEEADPSKRDHYVKQMRNILTSGKNFATHHNNNLAAEYFTEFLQVLPSENRDKSSGLVSKVAVYAGFASALIYFSASSITGNVISESSSSIISRSTIAIIVGILVVAAFALFSRKR